MPWQNITAVPMNREWQFSQIISPSAEWFRVRHETATDIFTKGWIAQVDLFTEFYGVRRIYPVENNTVFKMKSPPMFAERRIAVKQNPRQRTPLWIVHIDVWIP
ncbi:MAG TPA: hypothetical protein V6D25_30995 [Leptolyngbyaceae cyanobacterium]